jgi:hypothetical protein
MNIFDILLVGFILFLGTALVIATFSYLHEQWTLAKREEERQRGGNFIAIIGKPDGRRK